MSTTTSLKLPDALKARVAALAEHAGKSAHAYMLDAIERETGLAERRLAFVGDALAAERDMERSGLAYDAHDLHAYWRARLAGKQASKPKLKPWRG
jgi:predicted transcriptional regulator